MGREQRTQEEDRRQVAEGGRQSMLFWEPEMKCQCRRGKCCCCCKMKRLKRSCEIQLLLLLIKSQRGAEMSGSGAVWSFLENHQHGWLLDDQDCWSLEPRFGDDLSIITLTAIGIGSLNAIQLFRSLYHGVWYWYYYSIAVVVSVSFLRFKVTMSQCRNYRTYHPAKTDRFVSRAVIIPINFSIG